MPIGVNLLDISNMAGLIACEIMTSSALLLINDPAATRTAGIDRERIFRWRQGPDPVVNSFEADIIDCYWSYSRAERSTEIAFVHGGVVAVPVQVQSLARLLVP